MTRRQALTTVCLVVIVLLTVVMFLPAVNVVYPAGRSIASLDVDALKELSNVLTEYERRNGSPVIFHSSQLRLWARDGGPVVSNENCWWFQDPETKLLYDWIFAPAAHPTLRIFAPRSFQPKTGDRQRERVRLVCLKSGKVKIMPESEFFIEVVKRD